MIYSMTPLDRMVSLDQKKGFAWNRSALFHGLVMFLAYDFFYYVYHPQRDSPTRTNSCFKHSCLYFGSGVVGQELNGADADSNVRTARMHFPSNPKS
jgi:hypothetical protein